MEKCLYLFFWSLCWLYYWASVDSSMIYPDCCLPGNYISSSWAKDMMCMGITYIAFQRTIFLLLELRAVDDAILSPIFTVYILTFVGTLAICVTYVTEVFPEWMVTFLPFSTVFQHLLFIESRCCTPYFVDFKTVDTAFRKTRNLFNFQSVPCAWGKFSLAMFIR